MPTLPTPEAPPQPDQGPTDPPPPPPPLPAPRKRVLHCRLGAPTLYPTAPFG